MKQQEDFLSSYLSIPTSLCWFLRPSLLDCMNKGTQDLPCFTQPVLDSVYCLYNWYDNGLQTLHSSCHLPFQEYTEPHCYLFYQICGTQSPMSLRSFLSLSPRQTLLSYSFQHHLRPYNFPWLHQVLVLLWLMF